MDSVGEWLHPFCIQSHIRSFKGDETCDRARIRLGTPLMTNERELEAAEDLIQL